MTSAFDQVYEKTRAFARARAARHLLEEEVSQH